LAILLNEALQVSLPKNVKKGTEATVPRLQNHNQKGVFNMMQIIILILRMALVILELLNFLIG
jgi:hypothetical protein